MRIGLDFDNTIVCYDQVFHEVAVEKKVIPAETPVTKIAVRDYLRSMDLEDVWTKMQGYVYGTRMGNVRPFPDVIDTLKKARATGHELFIVSHKTRHPFMGPKYDLHKAARGWISEFLRDGDEFLVPPKNVNFREVKSDKIDRLVELGCDVFVDDLPEILTAPNFSSSVNAVLFDPEDNHRDFQAGNRVQSWIQLQEIWGLE